MPDPSDYPPDMWADVHFDRARVSEAIDLFGDVARALRAAADTRHQAAQSLVGLFAGGAADAFFVHHEMAVARHRQIAARLDDAAEGLMHASMGATNVQSTREQARVDWHRALVAEQQAAAVMAAVG